jgi:Tol biopolymer transport system component
MNLRRLIGLAACRSLPCGTWLALALCACGSNAVNVGDLPGGADSGAPDLVPGSSTGGSGCSREGLRDYTILFDSDGGGLERRIYSMRADGSELVALTPADELAREPALSPDGTQLAYATPEGLKLLDMATRESQLLVSGADQPSWSRDGTELAYRSEIYGLVVRQMSDGSEISGFGCNGCSSVEFTPDGTGLIYTTPITDTGIEVAYGVVTLSWGSGAGENIIPSAPVRMSAPTLSSDGVWMAIALQCLGSQSSSLWVNPLAVRTSVCEGHRTTAADAPNVSNPSWGPGVLIAYERGEPPRDIAIVAADTGEECVIAGPGDDRNPSWGIPTVAVPE